MQEIGGVTQRLIAYDYAKKTIINIFDLGIRSELYGTDYVFFTRMSRRYSSRHYRKCWNEEQGKETKSISQGRLFRPKSFERITTQQSIFISCIHKDFF